MLRTASRISGRAPKFSSAICGSPWDGFIEEWAPKCYAFVANALGPYHTEPRTEILAISGRASATAPAGSAIGKQVPNVPAWRATGAATYRAGKRVAVTLGARYSSKLYTTLDNADVHPNTYQGFASWFVADARVTAKLSDHFEAGLGVDNLNNRKYFLFHPFPQRTVVGNLRYAF